MNKWLNGIVTGILFSTTATAQEATADKAAAMSAVDLLSLPAISRPELSKDGRQILFNQSVADWDQDKRINHVWRVNADGTNPVQMTNGNAGEEGAIWAPDGRHIAFIAKRHGDKKRQLYVINNMGGEAARLTKHKTNITNISWSPDGNTIYFLANEDRSALEKQRKKDRDNMIRFDDDFAQRHVWQVNVKSGEAKQLTEGDYYVRFYNVSPDGSKIVYSRAPKPLLDNLWDGELWVMKADGSEAVQVTHNAYPETGARLSPDNNTILYRAGVNSKGEPYYNDNLFVISADGAGSERLLMPDLPYEIDAAEWGKSAKTIFFIANMGVHTELFELTVKKEKTKQLTNGKHAVRGWHYQRNTNSHTLAFATPNNVGDIWSLSSKGKLTQVTHVFDDLNKKFKLPRTASIQWKSDDGVTVEGLLYYPLDYTEGTRYPLVVQTHGGPLSSDKFGSFSTSRYAQVLTAKGYAVLQPNYRGSVGYGDTFARDMVGGYFTNAHLDVMTGVDAVVAMGVADPDTLVKMGWSAGGHLTNKIITHTDRFKAASSGAGAVNWISMYGQSDIRVNRTPWFGNTPWVKDAPIDVYWNNSPLKDIWKVTTPTLVLVGEKDVRVPSPQSVELHRALKFNGVTTKLYMAPGEPHGWRKLTHRLFKINVELDWFEKHARGQNYKWEKAPKKSDAKEESTDAK